MADYQDTPRRRANGDVRLWTALIVSLVTALLSLGVVYGRLGGRLDLIEYRLRLIELVVKSPGVVP